jgi:flagellar biosynthesis protein FlhB
VSDTKSEPASERTLARARARGDFPFTSDWTFAALLLGSAASSTYAVPLFVRAWSDWARGLFAGHATWQASLVNELFWPVSLLMLVPYLSVVAVTIVQRGATWRLWQNDPARGNEPPGAGGRSPLLAAGGRLLKLVVLAAVLAPELVRSFPGIVDGFARDAPELLPLLVRFLRVLCLRAGLTLVVLGALDLIVQQLARLARLRMSRREWLDEQRDEVGDPRWRGERRSRAAVLANERGMPDAAQLEAASLVVTGAARAVALRYRPGHDEVPVVWLKADGQAAVALVGRAYSLGLPLETDPWLAGELYRVELMQPIPEPTHARVAALLVAAGADEQEPDAS